MSSSIFGMKPKVVPFSVVKDDKVSENSNTPKLAKLISSVLGFETEGPTKFELAMVEELTNIAKQENGEFDEDEMCIFFGGEADGAEMVVHCFIEENEDAEEDMPDQYANFQAVLRTFGPSQIYIGDLKQSVKSAIQSLQNKMK